MKQRSIADDLVYQKGDHSGKDNINKDYIRKDLINDLEVQSKNSGVTKLANDSLENLVMSGEKSLNQGRQSTDIPIIGTPEDVSMEQRGNNVEGLREQKKDVVDNQISILDTDMNDTESNVSPKILVTTEGKEQIQEAVMRISEGEHVVVLNAREPLGDCKTNKQFLLQKRGHLSIVL